LKLKAPRPTPPPCPARLRLKAGEIDLLGEVGSLGGLPEIRREIRPNVPSIGPDNYGTFITMKDPGAAASR
jgi:hypothetical protein